MAAEAAPSESATPKAPAGATEAAAGNIAGAGVRTGRHRVEPIRRWPAGESGSRAPRVEARTEGRGDNTAEAITRSGG